ncbi:MAG TPA: peptide chain release factor N(5)-glutamine methyltransferase [Flavitalea sp.]|nr:peptide chain release factor N(5)-glutamine methyltransferase [Flavitalea sp.]
MTMQEASQQLLFQLYHVYDPREAGNIADLVLEHLTGWKKIDRVINKQVPLSAKASADFPRIVAALAEHQPVQYILGEAWFCGFKFYVNSQVLIPRPETEELTQWIISDLKQLNSTGPIVVDMGTGSGCIPLSIKKNIPTAQVSGFDISEGALVVATENARRLGVMANFAIMDLMNEAQFNSIPLADIIVSNPPYIPATQENEMPGHVTRFEPRTALFVKDEDPLIFYRRLSALGRSRMKENGLLYLEIHEEFGSQTADLLHRSGWSGIELRKDMQGKDRMIRAAY